MATPYINKKTQKTTSKISGYSPRSTDLFYNPAPKTTNTIRNNVSNVSNVISNAMSNAVSKVPTMMSKVASKVASKVPTMIPAKVPTTLSNAVSKVPTVLSTAAISANNGGISFFTFLLIVFILGFLGLTIYLYLEKPKDKDIIHLYDPVLNYIKQKLAEVESKAKNEKEEVKLKIQKHENTEKADELIEHNNSAIKKLDKSLNKPADDVNKNPVAELKPDEDSKKEMQMNKPVSKAGFCFIGEDRGNRSCIEVGEGDLCMSGDIFPTQAICINPRLRQ